MFRIFPLISSPRSQPLASSALLAISRSQRTRRSLATNQPPNPDLLKKIDEFRTTTAHKIGEFTSTATFNLGKNLNKLTGYDQIELLKYRVVEQEKQITQVRIAAREAKAAYERAVQERSRGQREVNDLLQRKSSWTDADVVRFTNLVRQDNLNEQEEVRAKLETARTDDAIETEFQELMRAILNRYHEEQVWSDKIRRLSTYGSLAVLGINLVVFVLAILVVEPFKRRKTVELFEKRIEQLSEETRIESKLMAAHFDEQFQKQQSLLSSISTPPLVKETRQYELFPIIGTAVVAIIVTLLFKG